MRAQADTTENSAAAVTPTIRPSMPWRVRDVAVLPAFRLAVRFVDGLSGIVDMSALIASAEAGVFSSLRDEAVFQQAYVERGAVTWPGELDIAPDAMHAAIKEHGEWRLS